MPPEILNRVTTLEIQGLRGFATPQTLKFALPNGAAGSGLTVLVGPNNGGKSTVIEAFRLFAKNVSKPPSVSAGKRNKDAGDSVRISLKLERGGEKTFRTREPGSSECEFEQGIAEFPGPELYYVPSRRGIAQYFAGVSARRDEYLLRERPQITRQMVTAGLEDRLLHAQRNKQPFNEVLSRIISPVPDWTIDQDDRGEFFVKIRAGNSIHNSEGIGDGLLSLLFIVDALYDSRPNDVVAIDEPELSLHPALQKRLAAVFKAYATDRQIIVATHSPYFVDLDSVANGAKVSRIKNGPKGSTIHTLQPETQQKLGGFLTDKNNPHVLGLDAREVFFLDDGIILHEGQEDVIFYKLVEQQLGKTLSGEVYGWGVGGADKMGIIASMLRDSGFTKVVGVLDKNKAARRDKLAEQFPDYHFFLLPADDIRSKNARPATPAVEGILDIDSEIRPRYREAMLTLFEEINAALK
jgi:predicted ATPase